MMIQSPSKVASNRTARLVREMQAPTFVSTREGEQMRLLRRAENFTHSRSGEFDWCHVCCRATDHFGEHSDEQLLDFVRSPRGRRLMAGV